MCLAVPAKAISIDKEADTAKVSLGGILKDVSLSLVEDVCIGDYLLIHVGFALNKLDEKEALLTLKAFEELADFNRAEGSVNADE
ncbi:MAG: HypC/HybG/HupF family hydrogenase formation chaperone [Pseudomonadales bacterium]|nr:HypC/HybG/HupF family hydrogenase formation chaperone [Pseudomonadales bacterium]PCI06765.1 MAG: HypC/HybG/HupF family hydrogenase formation chaperone [Gammaproteobacteria bacterium]